MAAINAWYATPERLSGLPGIEFGEQTNFFTRHRDLVEGKRAVIVGHFPGVEDFTNPALTVLERNPRGADLPDSAAEFVIPEAEVLVVTGSTMVNKTLPRLLHLARRAEVHVVGPTAPPAPGCYPPCVREIAGAMVVDADEAWKYAGFGIFQLIDIPAIEMFALPVAPPPAPQPIASAKGTSS